MIVEYGLLIILAGALYPFLGMLLMVMHRAEPEKITGKLYFSISLCAMIILNGVQDEKILIPLFSLMRLF